MKPSEILWKTRDRVAGKWCKKALRKAGSGGVCTIGGINQVTTGNVGHYSDEYEPLVVRRKLDLLVQEQGFRHIEDFNDAPHITKDDVLDLLEKAALYFEESGQ
jgi:hypothetical protein